MDRQSLLALLVFLAACGAAASTAAMFRPGQWYESLKKPGWRPPNWAFGPVWVVLYGLIAVAGWIVWREQGAFGLPLALYAIQLLLNAAWSPVFFGLRRMGTGLAVMVALWAAIAATIAAFYPVAPVAAYLLAPYLAWVTIASALNLSILRLNPPPASSPRRSARA